MVLRSIFICLGASALIHCGAETRPPPTDQQTAGRGGRVNSNDELLPPPSFDQCFPWKRDSRIEPPTFQLSSETPPYTFLFVMPGRATFGSMASGWAAAFDDLAFAPLWNLSVMARQQHKSGDDLTGADSLGYLLGVGCGDYFTWQIRVSEMYAQTHDEPAAQLARQLFSLMRDPPSNATHSP